MKWNPYPQQFYPMMYHPPADNNDITVTYLKTQEKEIKRLRKQLESNDNKKKEDKDKKPDAKAMSVGDIAIFLVAITPIVGTAMAYANFLIIVYLIELVKPLIK